MKPARSALKLTLAICLGWLAFAAQIPAAPVKVELVKTAGGWQLLRDGKPYFIKGAGGTARLDLLAGAGANSVRTWGADNHTPLLDEAQQLGLTVTVGIWLHHENDTEKFSYDNPEMLKQQLEVVRQTVLRYKDHPAVLMWGIGNEMEGYANGDNPKIWQNVNDAAKIAKELDPNHPTMTVIAEIGAGRIPSIDQFCPDIDIVGINSYAGSASLGSRYAALNPLKPYVITEFGPPGAWESGKTSWGAPLEPTSPEKAETYRRAYLGSILNQPWCVGSYAFLWGNKQETTATWYGMFLPDGTKVNAVDTMTELWSGAPPKDLCPVINQLKLEGANEVKPGQTVEFSLKAGDPADHPLTVRWVVRPEQTKTEIGGKEEPVLPELPAAIIASDNEHCTVSAPKEEGGYRVFAYVNNAAGASVGNVPFYVRLKDAQIAPGKTATLPFYIYKNKSSPENHYVASGWMGKTSAVKMNEDWQDNPHSAPSCLQCQYMDSSEWGGIVWQDPANDWGDRDGGWNLAGATKLVFWARGDKGGEVVAFKFGVLGQEKKFFDSASGGLDGVTLTPDWKEYTIDLTGKNLARIKSGFCWSVAGQGAPLTFYLDDIRFE